MYTARVNGSVRAIKLLSISGVNKGVRVLNAQSFRLAISTRCNCIKFGQLILRKNIKIVATTSSLMHQIKFELSAPPDLLARFYGSCFYGDLAKGEEGNGRKGE